jgi:hypothetical protein
VPQEGTLATGVHHETSPGYTRSAVGSVSHATGAAVLEEHVHYLMAFAHLDPMGAAIVQE